MVLSDLQVRMQTTMNLLIILHLVDNLSDTVPSPATQTYACSTSLSLPLLLSNACYPLTLLPTAPATPAIHYLLHTTMDPSDAHCLLPTPLLPAYCFQQPAAHLPCYPPNVSQFTVPLLLLLPTACCSLPFTQMNTRTHCSSRNTHVHCCLVPTINTICL